MKVIPLTQGKVALVSDDDFEYLNQFKWYARKDTNNAQKQFYASRNMRINESHRKTVSMHNFILRAPNGFVVDHKNHDGLDNRRENLRVCTISQNNQNVRKRKLCSSIYKGVTFHRATNRWIPQIRKNGKLFRLGSYDSEKEAAECYDIAAKNMFGSFALLNFL